MKARFSRHLLPLWVVTASVAVVSVSSHTLAASLQYWNPGGSGGDGIWGTSPGDKNWNTTAGAATGNTVWPDTGNEVAVFQDALGGTVTVFTPVLAAGLRQQMASYTIDAETVTLVQDNAAANPFIHVQTGTLTINSILAGSHGLIKTGDGNLALTVADTYTGTTSIEAGTLVLGGSLASTAVNIATGASLTDSNGGLNPAAAVTNAGTLKVDAPDLVTTYTQNIGGELTGGATLTVSGLATLSGGTVSGHLLGSTSLTSAGAVAITGTGTVTAGNVNIASGVLTNHGTLTATTRLDIAAGATLVAGGSQSQALLTTSGAGTGTWQGELTNTTVVAPGGIGGIGTLLVKNGNFTNSPSGTLNLDLATATHDLLVVSGTANFGGSLALSKVGTTEMAPFVPINVVAAGAYAGNFATLVENLDGAVWFNPRNGDVMRLTSPAPGGNTLFGATANQTSTWIALYDDVIDPGVTNITQVPGGNPEYLISSGLGNANNPDLLWALAASFTPAGLNPSLLNHLSPEVYVGLSDYAIQATRTHQRSAFSAPALAPATPSDSKADSKAGCKGGCKDATPNTTPSPWEFFAAIDSFHVESSQSHNQADYELSGFGVLGGVRTNVTDRVRVAAYLAADAGDISGQLINADSNGWSIGLLGEALLDEKTRTCLSAGISYGRYAFDGTRSSVAATGGGWSAAPAGFSDVASDSLELYVGVDGLLYQHEGFRLIPAFDLRAATGTMDGFTETTGSAPGSPIALVVNRDHYASVLADLSLRAEADVTNKISVWGLLGMSAGINNEPHALTARFAKGSRTFQTVADGLSNNSLVLGLGVAYKVNDSISVALGGRGEFRSNADPQTNFCLSSSFRF